MLLHRNAKLGLAGRYALVMTIQRTCSAELGREDATPSRLRGHARDRRRALSLCLRGSARRPKLRPPPASSNARSHALPGTTSTPSS